MERIIEEGCGVYKLIAAIVNFALAALNVWLAVKIGNPVSWVAAAFCFGMGIVVVEM